MRWQDKHRIVPAVFVIFRKNDKVLLLRRFNTGYMDEKYGLPSGHVDGDEPADVAACREAKEEVGVDLKSSDLRLVHTSHRLAAEGDHEWIDLYFEAMQWNGEPVNAEPDKCDELKWASIDDLPENTVPEVRANLENIKNSIPYSSFNFE